MLNIKCFTLILFALTSFFSNFSKAEVYNSDDVVDIAGTLRQDAIDSTKWCWVNNSKHTPIGVDRDLCGVALGNTITFNYGVTYSKVVTLVATPDETFLSYLDMNVGASVGLDKTIINVSSFGSPLSVDQWLGYSYGNIWISGKMIK